MSGEATVDNRSYSFLKRTEVEKLSKDIEEDTKVVAKKSSAYVRTYEKYL